MQNKRLMRSDIRCVSYIKMQQMDISCKSCQLSNVRQLVLYHPIASLSKDEVLAQLEHIQYGEDTHHSSN